MWLASLVYSWVGSVCSSLVCEHLSGSRKRNPGSRIPPIGIPDPLTSRFVTPLTWHSLERQTQPRFQPTTSDSDFHSRPLLHTPPPTTSMYISFDVLFDVVFIFCINRFWILLICLRAFSRFCFLFYLCGCLSFVLLWEFIDVKHFSILFVKYLFMYVCMYFSNS